MFSSFFSLIQLNTNQNGSSILLSLFQKFLSSRMISLLIEITSKPTLQGKNSILQQEHYETVMRNILHVCDVINNKFPHITSTFFYPSEYNAWLSNKIMNLFFCFHEDLSLSSFSLFLSKCCILGFSTSLASSFYHTLCLFNKTIKPSSSDEKLLLLQDRKTLLSLFQQFISHLPSIRQSDFYSQFFHLLFSSSNQTHSLSFSLVATVLLSQSSFSPSSFITLIISQAYPLSPLLSFFYSISHSPLLASLIQSLLQVYNHPSFNQIYSTQQQIYILSLIYCLLKTSILSSSENDSLLFLMKGVGSHLSNPNEQCKSIVIGIAAILAKAITPESDYSWPTYDVNELDRIADSVCNIKVEEEKEVEEEKKEEVKEEKKEEEREIIKKEKDWIEVDEEVNIFDEEMKQMLFSNIDDEEDIQLSLDHQDPEQMEEIEEFLPFDLTEPTSQTAESKQYFYLMEPITDLSDQDSFIRLHAWKSFYSLCLNEQNQATSKEITTILKTILEIEDMTGDENFWKEYEECIACLLYRKVDTGMTTIFDYIKQNSRNNMTITKCGYLIEGILQGALMLVEGTMSLPEDRNTIPKNETPIEPIIMEDDGNSMKVQKTKYKPSYYRMKMEKERNQEHSSLSTSTKEKEQVKKKNCFTENASLFLNCFLTWIIRCPPRNTQGISYVLTGLTTLCKLPVLNTTFNECFADITKVILRYRYHSEAILRQNSLELFIATTRFEHRECIDKKCEELQHKEKIQAWMIQVYQNDPNDICRLLAKSILSQLYNVSS